MITIPIISASGAKSVVTVPNPVVDTGQVFTVHVGEQTILPVTDGGNANLIVAQQVTLPAGIIQSLSFFVAGGAGSLRLAVYSNNGGQPGNKVAQTSTLASVTAGWNTLPATAPVEVPGGTYWLAYELSSHDVLYRRSATGAVSYAFAQFSTGFPVVFPPGPATATGVRSMYVTLTTNVAPPPPPPPPPDPVALVEIDGGPNYFGQFSNSLPTDPSYFPIGAWFLNTITEQDVALDKDFGYNLYVVLAGDSNWNFIRDAGMQAIPQPGYWNSNPAFIGNPAAVGWELHDEIDMQMSAPAAFTELHNVLASLPADNKLRYNNYGKGVCFWNSDADAARFINEFQHVTSADTYWFTDPWISSASEGGKLLNNSFPLTPTQTRRAANYGYTVDRIRALDAMDGVRKPIWGFVELGWPFLENEQQGGRAITPAEARAAVWHSIIAGARGIMYFDTSFGGPNFAFSCTRDPAYAQIRATMKAVNALIKQLAPVLNSHTETGYLTVSPSVRAMVKNYQGKRWVFAGSRENMASTATFTLKNVSTGTAMVEGENRSIPITGGVFTDPFADGNAVHVYRIVT